MNRTLLKTYKTVAAVLSMFLFTSVNAQTIPGDSLLNFTNGDITNICSDGVNFFDDGGMTQTYNQMNQLMNGNTHTIRFIGDDEFGNFDYGARIRISINNAANTGLDNGDTLAIYANAPSLIGPGNTLIFQDTNTNPMQGPELIFGPNLIGYLVFDGTNTRLFDTLQVQRATIIMPMDADAVFYFKSPDNITGARDGWDLTIQTMPSAFQGFASEVLFDPTNNPQPERELNDAETYVFCPNQDYDFVFDVFDVGRAGVYTRAIPIDSMIIDYGDGTRVDTVVRGDAGFVATNPNQNTRVNTRFRYTTPGVYEVRYTIYDRNCDNRTRTQYIAVLGPPAFTFSSIVTGPDYTVCVNTEFSINVLANPGMLNGPDTSQTTTTNSLMWLPPMGADAILDGPQQTLTFQNTNAPGDYNFTARYTYEENVACFFDNTVMVTVEDSVNSGFERMNPNGEATSTCSTTLNFNLFSLLDGTPTPGGAWINDAGDTISNIIDPSAYFAMGGAGIYFFRYSVDGGTCGIESTQVRLNIIRQPYAGDKTIFPRDSICSSNSSVNLFSYIDMNGTRIPDAGGTWSSNVAGAETAITGNSLNASMLDLGAGNQRDFNFIYTVRPSDLTAGCVDDRATVRLRVIRSPNAGNDSTLFICTTEGVINLNTLLSGNNYMGQGIWRADAATTSQRAFDGGNTFIPVEIDSSGTYIMSYFLDRSATGVPPCVSDQINITFEVMTPPDAGDDAPTVIDVCNSENMFDLFNALGRKGDTTSGLWFGPGNVLVEGTGGRFANLDTLGGQTVTFTYIIEGNQDLTLGRGCMDDMATVTVRVQQALFVGTSRMNLPICITDAPFSLYDSLGGVKDPGGVWMPSIQGNSASNALFNPQDPSVVLNDTVTYTYSHPSNSPGCVNLESFVSLTVYDLPVAGADNMQLVDICDVNQTFDLKSLIQAGIENGVNGTTMLTWSFESTGANAAPVDPLTGIVDISLLGDADGEDYRFNYIVRSIGCVSDTAVITIRVFARGNAGNDASFRACSDGGAEFTLFDLINNNGNTDITGVWSDVNGTGGLNGTDNDATFIPENVTATTMFPPTADSLYYIVSVPNCPDDSAAVLGYISSSPLAGIGNSATGVDGPLKACENEEMIDLFDGLSGDFQDTGRFRLDIWPPGRNSDMAFRTLRQQVNNPALGYFSGRGNMFSLERFDTNFIRTHSNDPKQLFSSTVGNGPVFRFSYVVSDTTNFPVADMDYGYLCPGDSAFVFVRIEADFTNTDNFNFELVTNQTIANSLNPVLNTVNQQAVVCQTETDFRLNDYFPGLTDIINCVNPPQDEFEINDLPAGSVYRGTGANSSDFFVNATEIDSSFTDFESITLNVTNECGSATTQAPLNLRIEPFIETRPIDPIALCGNGDPIDLSLEQFIGQYYGPNFDLFEVVFDPEGAADDILVTVVDVDPSRTDFASTGSPVPFIINLTVDRMHCPDVVVPINITVTQEPYAGEDQIGVRICEGGVISLSDFVDPAATSPSTGQVVNTTGTFTCTNCSPSFTPQPYSSATFNTANQGGNILEFRYTVTNPGCMPVTARLQLIVEEKPFPGVSQTVTVCNNQTNLFLPALLADPALGLPDGGGTFRPNNLNGQNGNFLDVTQLTPGTYTLVYEVGNGIMPCFSESATLTLIVQDAPSAGTDGSIDVCLNQGVVNLFNGLNGQADTTGGRFVPVNPAVSSTFLSGPSNSLFDFTSYVNNATSPKPTMAMFQYIVEASNCPSDTAVVTVNILPVPKSGIMDTIPVTVCNDLMTFDLFTVLGNVETGNGAGDYLAGGRWTATTAENGNLMGSVINPSVLTGGITHNFRYTVSTTCGNSFSIVRVRIDAKPILAMDVTDSICGTGQVINLFTRYPQFRGGTWEDVDGVGGLVGNLFDYTLASEQPTYNLEYRVPSQLGVCNDAVAKLTLRVFDLPNAGQDTVTAILCKSEGDVDLFDILIGETAGGMFTAPPAIGSNLVGSILRVGNIADGDYNIFYDVKSGPCTPDRALIRVRISGTNTTSFVCGDLDGDGIINKLDLDIDNDGISNLLESNGLDLLADHDNDLVPNFMDGNYATFIGSSFENGVITMFDPDRDGVINMFDLDSDGDGIFDIVEAFPLSYMIYDAPSSADGQTDTQNSDGINDAASNDVVVNTDGVDFPDYLDLDSDNDGISDRSENGGQAYITINTDAPADNLANYRDLDSDNDGISDMFENNGGNSNNPVDTDGDNMPDYVDFDSDNDGILDADEAFLDLAGLPEDRDMDGLFNFQDLDSDGDFILDSIEGLDALGVLVDTDGDGIEDFRDLDSDNDGISDKLESLLKSEGGTPNDADDDSNFDFREIDSDDDQLTDSLEAGIDFNAPLDSDNDGIYDFQEIDADNDGLLDNFEANAAVNPATGFIENPVDSDTDGKFDFQDEDSDNDGIPDLVEGTDATLIPGVDTDGDLIPDYLDLDSDDDTLLDEQEKGLDGNNPDDSDGDGIFDFREVDSDGDGILDRIESDDDCDNDGTPNYKDAGDNCRIETFVPEGFSPNGDNVNDLFVIPDINTFPKAELTVYNRWGSVVFATGPNVRYQNFWNGDGPNGTTLPDGTYFYSLDLGLGQEAQTGFVYIVGNE